MQIPIGLVLLLLAGVVALSFYLHPTPEQIGQALQQGGRLDEALKYYTQGLQADPSDEPLRVRIASVNELRGQPDEAIALYEQLIALDPDDLGYRRQLATYYDWSLQVDDSMVQKQKIAELDPKDVVVRYSLADYYVLTRKDYDGAIRLMREVVAARPGDAEALVELAQLYVQTRRVPEALETYRKAQEEDPSEPTIGRGLARLQAWTQQMQDAIERNRLALADAPNDVVLLGNLEEMLRRVGQTAEADAIRQRRGAGPLPAGPVTGGAAAAAGTRPGPASAGVPAGQPGSAGISGDLSPERVAGQERPALPGAPRVPGGAAADGTPGPAGPPGAGGPPGRR